MTSQAELENLLHFLYQCPVGLIEIDNAGAVRQINPAAVRMLGPLLDGDNLTRLFPLLTRLAPGLVASITAIPGRMGSLTAGHRVLVPTGGTGDPDCVEILCRRVGLDRVMIVLVDVSQERRLAQREHELVAQLQQAMLGRIDRSGGVAAGGVYRPAEVGLLMGGDWYEVIALPAGRTALTIGDIVGHSVSAAAAMGQMRSAVRAIAPSCDDPAQLLTRADQVAADVPGAAGATMACAILDRASGRLTHCSAGHPPALLVRRDGTGDFLTGGRGTAIASVTLAPRENAQETLVPGDTVVLYTDGLVERRDALLSDGMERLRSAAVGLRDEEPDALARHLADRLCGDQPNVDDVCVLAVRYLGADQTG